MKKLNKMCKCIISVFCVIVFIVTGSVVRVKADNSDMAVSVCVTQCKRVLGAASLSAKWDYNDGDYVGSENYSALYVPNDNGSVCSFDSFKENGYSNGWSYVQCEYFAMEGDCAVWGKLYVSCDTYGERDNNSEIILARCFHQY